MKPAEESPASEPARTSRAPAANDNAGARSESSGPLYRVEGRGAAVDPVIALPADDPANDDALSLAECDALMAADPEFDAWCDEREAARVEAVEDELFLAAFRRTKAAVECGSVTTMDEDDECVEGVSHDRA